jgi:hypothetical protein
MIYPLIHDLVAETPEEKKRSLLQAVCDRFRVVRLIYDITNYIVENGFKLIDITGKPTSW